MKRPADWQGAGLISVRAMVSVFKKYLTPAVLSSKIPSLTLVKSKSGYKPSSYAGCSHFLCGTDLCYFFPSSVLVLFIMLRMADFEINS